MIREATGAAQAVLDGFLPAWLAGGRVRVGLPLGADEVEALGRLILRNRAPDGLAQARGRLAGELVPLATPLPLGPTDVLRVAVLHNLVALGHPALGRADARPGGLEAALGYTLELATRLRLPDTVDDALAAHTLIGPLFDAERMDAEVIYWLGRRHYPGRTPPKRMTRLPRLRQVAVHRFGVPLVQTFGVPDRRGLLARLLLASPVTDLLTAGRPAPRFTFGATARWLADPDLARGILYRWLQAPDPSHLGGVLTRALLVRVRAGAPRAEVVRLLQALYHLHLLGQHAALTRGEPETVAEPGHGEGRWYLALYKVLHRGGDVFGLPTADELGVPLAARLDGWLAAAGAVDTASEESVVTETLGAGLHLMGYPEGRPALE